MEKENRHSAKPSFFFQMKNYSIFIVIVMSLRLVGSWGDIKWMEDIGDCLLLLSIIWFVALMARENNK